MLSKLVNKTIVIATRKSRLAIWQANFVRKKILLFHPQISVKILPLSTEGDRRLDHSLAKIGGKGLFIKELELALETGKADIAVHSMKDLPYEIPESFSLVCVLEREDPRDVFISNNATNVLALSNGGVVGTSSFRRSSQILLKYPHVRIAPLRGNLETRLKKLDDGKFDGIVLAAAGIKRLEMSYRISSFLELDECLSAVGQGAIGVECLQERYDLSELLGALEHPASRWCIEAERAMSRELGGNCNFPIAGYACIIGSEAFLKGFVGHPDGSEFVAEEGRQNFEENPKNLGKNVAKSLIEKGALDLLAKL